MKKKSENKETIWLVDIVIQIKNNVPEVNVGNGKPPRKTVPAKIKDENERKKVNYNKNIIVFRLQKGKKKRKPQIYPS